MSNIKVCPRGVLKQLKSLNPNKSTGPDGIPPRVLKEMADVLATPLTNLFQMSLDKGVVPDDWKKANVSPIYKKGEKYLASNYRPVSLTCVVSKVLEHIVTSHMMNYAEEHKLLFRDQHGFRRNRSCERQLLELVCDIAKRLDEGRETDACVLDFSKAFDKVNHSKLLLKLANYGVSHQIVSWIDSFLSQRLQKVVIEDAESTESHVSSGVPQGSVIGPANELPFIGPALFLFYINDLPDSVKSRVRLFADDTIIYNDASSPASLQHDLEMLEKWESEWDMEFHPKKCEHIVFTRKRNQTTNEYKLHNTCIPKSSCIKYLGVHVDSKLSWNQQVDKTSAKANSTLGFVRRNVITTSEDIKLKAYKQLVRPILEYASCAWDSVGVTKEKKLEAVQRRAARFVCGIRRTDRKTSTTGLLQRLNLPVLSERRGTRRLQLFRQYHHHDSDIIKEYIDRIDARSSRRHCMQYFIPATNTAHYQKTFFLRTARDWNALPADSLILSSPSIH